MTKDEIKTKVLEILGGIAPEADLLAIKPDVELREQLDTDSIDYLNFVIALDEGFQADIPERDYARLLHLTIVSSASKCSSLKDNKRKLIIRSAIGKRG
jgi:acyl carrier protein